MKGKIIQTTLLLVGAATSHGQTSQPRDLTALEENVAKQFNELRTKGGMQPISFRRDLRVRKEACSVQVKGPDATVEDSSPKRRALYKFWYLSSNPIESSNELAQLSRTETRFDHVAVGVWFAKTATYPSGMYWVVVYPEHGAAHEAFWSHFYLSDGFEYETVFDKHWREQLPEGCASLK